MKTTCYVFHIVSYKAKMVSCVFFPSLSYIFSLCFCSLWVESVFVPTGFELSLGHYFDECVVNMCEQHPSVRQT